MGNDKIGLIGLMIALVVVAIAIGQSNIEPLFVKGGFVFGCLIGAVLSAVGVVKGD